MPDRGRVIGGLKCLADGCVEACESVNACASAVAKDALELLKEYEPHVLAYEDAITAEYFVMEIRDSKELYQFVHDPLGYFSPSLNSDNHKYFEGIVTKDEYNRFTRCWSSRPTDEQREAVKWDATD